MRWAGRRARREEAVPQTARPAVGKEGWREVWFTDCAARYASSKKWKESTEGRHHALFLEEKRADMARSLLPSINSFLRYFSCFTDRRQKSPKMSPKPHSKGTNKSSLWIWMTLYLYGQSARHLLTSRPRSQRRFQMAGAVAWTTSFLASPTVGLVRSLREKYGPRQSTMAVSRGISYPMLRGGRSAVQSRAGRLSVFLGRESEVGRGRNSKVGTDTQDRSCDTLESMGR
ncbi:hypothetical protein LZ30DRAFT_149097 [Colletotrichum cereale]|nr:hypothetical protein LZ30DRAFT_149097 [Colletotrichum cereale]